MADGERLRHVSQVQNSIDVQTSVYVEGNLCVDNTAEIERPANLVVKGNLILKNPQNSVGRAGTGAVRLRLRARELPSTRNLPAHLPCSGEPDNVTPSTSSRTRCPSSHGPRRTSRPPT